MDEKVLCMEQKRNLRKRIINGLASIVLCATLMGFSPSAHFNNVDGHTQVRMQMMNSAYAKEIGNFKKPSLKGYSFQQAWDDDWNENGIKDTTIKLYKNSRGNAISKAYKKGSNQIWGWSLNTNNDNNKNILKNYVIVDTDGDGDFDTRYSLNDDVPLPSWVK